MTDSEQRMDGEEAWRDEQIALAMTATVPRYSLTLHQHGWVALLEDCPDGEAYIGSGPTWQAAMADMLREIVRGME